MSRLQSGSVRSLNLAPGLLLTGQGDPVDAFRMTINRSVLRRDVPSNEGILCSGSSEKTSRKRPAIASGRYLAFQRRYKGSLTNMSRPLLT